MPAKEILVAIEELKQAGWRVVSASGRSHAYARAYWSGWCERMHAADHLRTPKVPEHEAAKIRKAMRRCPHSGREDEQ